MILQFIAYRESVIVNIIFEQATFYLNIEVLKTVSLKIELLKISFENPKIFLKKTRFLRKKNANKITFGSLLYMLIYILAPKVLHLFSGEI